jgi:hypothetical protein
MVFREDPFAKLVIFSQVRGRVRVRVRVRVS